MGDTLDNHLTGQPSVVHWWWSDWIEYQEEALFWYQVHLEVEHARQEKEQLQQHFKTIQVCIKEQIKLCKEWQQGDNVHYAMWPWNCNHSPENNSLWLHHYPSYLNLISSHDKDNGTYPNNSSKVPFGYPIIGIRKELLATSPSSTMTTLIHFTQLNSTSTLS